MGQRILIVVLLLASSLNSYGQSSEDDKKPDLVPKIEVSRRGFFQGLLGLGAAAVVASPGVSVASTILPKSGLSPKVLKEIAKLRIKTFKSASGMRGAGLESYIVQLRRIQSKVNSQALKSLLEDRIGLAEKTLDNIRWIQGASHQKLSEAPKLNSTGAEADSNIGRISEIKRKIYNDYINMSIDLKIVTIRTLLDPALLNRMAWQWEKLDLSKGFYPEVLTVEEVEFLREYRLILESFRSSASESPLAKRVLEQTLSEIGVSLYAYKQVRRHQLKVLRCRSVF